MPKKIDESNVQKLRIEIKRLERRLNERDKQSGKESIWSIHPKWRGWFYGILSFCGIVMSVFTVFTMYGKDDKSWIEIFDAIWNGIVGSVVVVWFGFQSTDWIIPRFKLVINRISKIMPWGDPFREAQREKGREEGRQEERDRQSRFEESLRKQNVS